MALKLSVKTFGKRDVSGFDPNDLIPNFSTFTGRSNRSQEAIDAMAESLLKFGQEQPFAYRKGFGDVPIPISGHTRILAAAKITNERMEDSAGVVYSPENPFIVHGYYRQMNDMEAVIHTFVENDDPTRTPLNDLDHALLIRILSENYGLQDSEIADKLGKNGGWVAKHKKVLDLDHNTQQEVATGGISLDAAVTVVAAIEPGKRSAVIEKAKASNNGRATATAISDAAREMNVTTAGKLKRTASELDKWITDAPLEIGPGALQDLLLGMKEFRAGGISADDLTMLAKKADKK